MPRISSRASRLRNLCRKACPECDRGPRDTSLSVSVGEDGAIVNHCFRCGYTHVEGGHARDHPVADVVPINGLAHWAAKFWSDAQPIKQGSIAWRYLTARCCAIPPADGDLRFHADTWHSPSKTSGPALVALVTDAITNKPISIHRTWIQADGTKAKVDLPRMLAAGHHKARGVIRLWPDEAVTLGLHVAEGIETALSIATARTPVWSVIDAGNMAKFPVLAGIEALSIFADHDVHGKGLDAAKACCKRWRDAGLDARVFLPPHVGQDWNDVARNC